MIRPSNILSPSFQQSSPIDPVCLPQHPVNSRSHSHSIPHIPPSKDSLLSPLCTLYKVYPSSSHCNCLPQSNSSLLSSPSHCFFFFFFFHFLYIYCYTRYLQLDAL